MLKMMMLVTLLTVLLLPSGVLTFTSLSIPRTVPRSYHRGRCRTASSSSPAGPGSLVALSLAVSASSPLKPAALPLMDSGKAVARSGELLIDLTQNSLMLYGGGLSACGAQIRNAGDCLAQAAASCRFKTGAELVCDELREAATCLKEASDKAVLAVEEAKADEDATLEAHLGKNQKRERSAIAPHPVVLAVPLDYQCAGCCSLTTFHHD